MNVYIIIYISNESPPHMMRDGEQVSVGAGGAVPAGDSTVEGVELAGVPAPGALAPKPPTGVQHLAPAGCVNV